MGTPLYNTDVIPLTSRPTLTVMDDGDYFVILDTSTGKISKILRTDVQKALSISYDNSTSGLTAENVQSALDELVVNLGSSDSAISAIKGTGYTDGTLKTHEDRLDTLEGADTVVGSVAKTVKDAVTPIETRLDTTELTLARQGQDLSSVKQTIQQGNGATLDFSDIGIVPLDARATGRANPTVEGLTATNLITNGDFSQGTSWWGGGNSTISANAKILSVTGDGTKNDPKVIQAENLVVGNVYFFVAKVRVTNPNCLSIQLRAYATQVAVILTPVENQWYTIKASFTALSGQLDLRVAHNYADSATANGKVMQIDGNYGVMAINLTSIYGSGNEPSEADCAKIFSYFNGTKSISMPARVRSVSEDESETSTIYIADNEEVRSFGATTDLVKVVNGEFVLEKNVNDDATAVISPPVITPLLTSGILQAKPNGTVYFEPWYEGSHQTNASSQITLPYTGTIDKLTGYDENLEPYEVPSTGYTLVGTTLTVTGAVENEVFYVELSRSEPLAPEMEVNVINNEQVIADTSNGKFYKLVPTITNGSLVIQTPVEVV